MRHKVTLLGNCPRRPVLVILRLVLAGAMAAASASGLRGDEQGQNDIGRCCSEAGSILRRAPGQRTWELVPRDGALKNEEALLGAVDGCLDSANGGVRLLFRGDLDGSSPFPIVETAIMPHQDKDVDFAFTLDRGRVELRSEEHTS